MTKPLFCMFSKKEFLTMGEKPCEKCKYNSNHYNCGASGEITVGCSNYTIIKEDKVPGARVHCVHCNKDCISPVAIVLDGYSRKYVVTQCNTCHARFLIDKVTLKQIRYLSY